MTTTDLPPTLAERAIRRRIARHGPITFAEFMAAALYGPGGYYTRPAAGADYYTGPLVHPAFGALLAIQLFHLWALLERPDPFNVLEPGGGDGLLCRDILTASRHLPDGFGDAINYAIIDRRPAAGWEHGFPNADRVVGDFLALDQASARSPAHCVLSNELLDAMPVHRVRMEGGHLRELYVAIESDVADGYEGALVEQPGELSTPNLESRLSDLGHHPGRWPNRRNLPADWTPGPMQPPRCSIAASFSPSTTGAPPPTSTIPRCAPTEPS